MGKKAKPTKLWYLVSLLMGLVGGIIGYCIVKNDDKKMANKLLITGTVITAIPTILYTIVFGTILSSIFLYEDSDELTGRSISDELSTTEITAKMGFPLRNDNIEVNVLSLEISSSYTYYDNIWEEEITENATSGKKFVFINAEIKNLGNLSTDVGYYDFSIADSEGYRYDAEYYYLDDSFPSYQQIYKDEKIGGKVSFIVPETSNGFEVKYAVSNTELWTWGNDFSSDIKEY